MSDEPKGGLLPLIAIGLAVIGCCLGPVFIGSAMAGLSGWFAGLTIGETTSLAFSAGLIVYGIIRFGRPNKKRGRDSSAQPLK